MSTAVSRILVTGATGYIGENLIPKLEKEYELSFISGSSHNDLCDSRTLAKMEKTDVVIHLAAKSGVGESWNEPATFYEKNFLMTLNVLEYCRHWRIPIVYMSSYMYGTPEKLPTAEDSPAKCNNPYARSKYLGEQLVEGYARDFGVPAIVLRLFNLYGKEKETANSVVAQIVRQLKRAGSITIAHMDTSRDWLFIDDLTRAIKAVLSKPIEGYSVFNLGSGTASSIKQLVVYLEEIVGNPITVEVTGKKRVQDVSVTCADIRRFSEKYHWLPQIDLKTGLRLTWEHAN